MDTVQKYLEYLVERIFVITLLGNSFSKLEFFTARKREMEQSRKTKAIIVVKINLCSSQYQGNLPNLAVVPKHLAEGRCLLCRLQCGHAVM
jgi:hypothetical protein